MMTVRAFNLHDSHFFIELAKLHDSPTTRVTILDKEIVCIELAGGLETAHAPVKDIVEPDAHPVLVTDSESVCG
jgi:hypothetical protein